MSTRARGNSSRRRAALTVLLVTVSTCGLVASLPALAQDSSSAQEARITFSIPPQPLTSGIVAFSSRTGVDLVFDGAVPPDARTGGVSGTMTLREGVDRLLAGTGLAARLSGARTVQIQHTALSASSPAPDGAIALDTIDVQTPTYGTVGFVASHSTAGTKSNVPLKEVPAAISVVTRDELDTRGVQDFNAAVAYTPGIKVIDYPGGQGAPDIYIRGYRTINFLGIYQDGLRAGFNNYDQNIETYGLERIDVIKGPVSALYGQGAPGGIVNLLTKRPQFTRLNEIQIQGGTDAWRAGAFDLTGPVGESGQFAYRLTGLVRQADTPVAFSPDDRVYIAPAFTWKPSENTSLTILANHLDVRRGGSEQSLPISGTLQFNPVGGRLPRNFFLGEPYWNQERIRNSSIGYIFDHAFNDAVRIQSTTRYTDTESDYKTIGASLGGALLNNRLYRRGAALREQESRSFLTDNRAEVKFETWAFRHTLLAGVDYSAYERDERRRVGTAAPLDIFAPVYGRPIVLPVLPNVSTLSKLEQVGVYLQDQIKLDRFILTLGLRRDWAESKTTNRNTRMASTRPDEAWSYRAGLGYEFDEGFVPYVSYSTSFNPQAFSDANGRPFDPSEGKQIEAGVKYQPTGSNSYASAAVYEITQTNVPTADPLNPGFFTQSGETKSRGFELEGKSSFDNGVSVIASYAYLDAKVTKDSPNSVTGISLEGNRLERVPRHSASLWLDYAFKGGMFDGLRTGAGLRYVGSTTNTTNVDHIPGYGLLDASLSYDLGRLDAQFQGAKVSITAQNLLDKRYYQAGFYQGTVIEGGRRTVLGTLSYRF